MKDLARVIPYLPATNDEMMLKVRHAEEVSRGFEQVPLQTEHLLHAGMYSRTVTLPTNTVLIGVLIKVPTVVHMVGSATVLIGDSWADVDGVRVLPALAGRKQVFVSRSPFVITMMFPTDARTVAEAEAQFTDEPESLLSRQQGFNIVSGERV